MYRPNRYGLIPTPAKFENKDSIRQHMKFLEDNFAVLHDDNCTSFVLSEEAFKDVQNLFQAVRTAQSIIRQLDKLTDLCYWDADRLKAVVKSFALCNPRVLTLDKLRLLEDNAVDLRIKRDWEAKQQKKPH